MSMYSHTQTREHKRRSENEFESLVAVHSDHVFAIIVELVMQILFILALIIGVMFVGVAYARAVVHFTSMMWDLPHPETSTEHV